MGRFAGAAALSPLLNDAIALKGGEVGAHGIIGKIKRLCQFIYRAAGPAQQHHAHYKCTVYYTEVTRVGWPLPYTTRNEDAREVIYVDHNHMHMVGNVDTGLGSDY